MKYELMQGDGFCRSCGTLCKRHTSMAIRFYSQRDSESVLLCRNCVLTMAALIDEHRYDNMFKEDEDENGSKI